MEHELLKKIAELEKELYELKRQTPNPEEIVLCEDCGIYLCMKCSLMEDCDFDAMNIGCVRCYYKRDVYFCDSCYNDIRQTHKCDENNEDNEECYDLLCLSCLQETGFWWEECCETCKEHALLYATNI